VPNQYKYVDTVVTPSIVTFEWLAFLFPIPQATDWNLGPRADHLDRF